MSTKSKPDATEVAERCPLCGSDRLLNDPHDDGSLDAYSCFLCGSEWRNVRKADMQASEPAALPVEPLIARAIAASDDLYKLRNAIIDGKAAQERRWTRMGDAAVVLRQAADALVAAREREARHRESADSNLRAALETSTAAMTEFKARADAAEQALREVRAERQEWADVLREMRNAVSAAMRVVADLDAMKAAGAEADTLQQRFVDELRVSGVRNGFGKRADALLAALAKSAPPGQET